eukprot:14724178-Ditylum_brightwellii.AAC.1
MQTNCPASLSLIIARFPTTTLEEWDSLAKERMQSITVRADLPHERQHLPKYIPHNRRETVLNSKWWITLQSHFYEIKNDTSIILHLK